MARRGRTAALITLFRALRGAARPDEPSLGERLRALPRFVRATVSGRYRGTTTRQLGVMAAALLYVLSPVDLVPEAFIPFLGLADDAVVAAWLAGRLLGDTADYLGWERSTARSTPRHPDVVQGHVVR